MRRLATRLTASVTSAALGLGLLVVTPRDVLASAPADQDQQTTFLGLEGDADQVGALSDAIRWDLNQRGMDDGSTMTLAELKLTMGCADDDLNCFAQGGQTLGSSQLVFGSVTKQGDDYFVVLQALDVEGSELVNRIERTVPSAELDEAELGKTAASLVDELYGLAPPPEPEEPDPVVTAEPEGPSEEPSDEVQYDDGPLVWGPYKPRPGWKYAGLGISAGLMLGSLGTAIATTIMTGENGSATKDIKSAAEDSFDDEKTGNDIDPDGPDPCAAADVRPDPDRPNEVANAAVTQACIKADNLKTVATIGWIGTGVFAATTILFTTLLFVHRDKSQAAAKLHRHRVGLGGAPTRDGGVVFGGTFSF